MANNKARYRSAHGLGREYRFVDTESIEVRDGGKAKPDTIVLSGQPIVYGVPYSVRDAVGDFQETMHKGVVTDLLASGVDCRLLVNHTGLPYARTLSGTMQLNDSDTGLNFTADLDARSQAANDLAVAVERGDVSQMSCGFVVSKDKWSPDYTVRDVYGFKDLVDVSAVTYPASPTTQIEVIKRMVEQIEESEIPWSDQVRMRKMWNIAVDLRAGKVLSTANAKHVASLLDNLKQASEHISALAEAGGVEAPEGNDADDAANTDGSGSSNINTETKGGLQDGTDGASNGNGPNGSWNAPMEDGAGSRGLVQWRGPSLIEDRGTPAQLINGATTKATNASAAGNHAQAAQSHTQAAQHFTKAATAHAGNTKQNEADLKAAAAHTAAAAAHNNAATANPDQKATAASAAKAATQTATDAGAAARAIW